MDRFVGTIVIFCGNYAPLNWEFCHGQLLSISNYNTLYALIGTTYGGDGQNTFALPDLRGRVPVGVGQGPGLQNIFIGQSGGTETVILTANNLPAHNHSIRIGVNTTVGDEISPTNVLASNINSYAEDANTTLGGVTVANAGNSQPLSIRNPSQVVNYIIATAGIFPSQF
jgi:microcystin-dependent protein